jgi:hypothetical protein
MEKKEMWREAVVAYFRVLCRNFPEETEEPHGKYQLKELVSEPRFKPGTF